MKTCPRCGLPNTDAATKCACTYNFIEKKSDMDKKLDQVPQSVNEVLEDKFKRSMIHAVWLMTPLLIFIYLLFGLSDLIPDWVIIVGIIITLPLFLVGFKQMRENYKEMQNMKDVLNRDKHSQDNSDSKEDQPVL